VEEGEIYRRLAMLSKVLLVITLLHEIVELLLKVIELVKVLKNK